MRKRSGKTSKTEIAAIIGLALCAAGSVFFTLVWLSTLKQH